MFISYHTCLEHVKLYCCYILFRFLAAVAVRKRFTSTNPIEESSPVRQPVEASLTYLKTALTAIRTVLSSKQVRDLNSRGSAVKLTPDKHRLHAFGRSANLLRRTSIRVGIARFELATSRVRGERPSKLAYTP